MLSPQQEERQCLEARLALHPADRRLKIPWLREPQSRLCAPAPAVRTEVIEQGGEACGVQEVQVGEHRVSAAAVAMGENYQATRAWGMHEPARETNPI